MEKYHPPQVASYEQLTAKNFHPDFFLTCRPRGNKIQLQSFDGCDSVETDSPIEHHPGRTGERMLTLRGEHFCFQAEHIGILGEGIGVLRPQDEARYPGGTRSRPRPAKHSSGQDFAKEGLFRRRSGPPLDGWRGYPDGMKIQVSRSR